MNKILTLLIFIFILFPVRTAFADTWYFPMDKYFDRQSVKGFGQFIDDNFYKGKESLFPFNRFYGYHTGVDLDTSSSEKNQKSPVFSIYSGTITHIGDLSGYGGVILEKLDGENATALYGHVKISNLPVKVGDHITSDKPFILTYLGDEFSSETSGERKHLHFGIHKGSDLYFHGHERDLTTLNSQWYNPNDFLKQKNAKDPIQISHPQSKSQQVTNNNFLHNLIGWILPFRDIFQKAINFIFNR